MQLCWSPIQKIDRSVACFKTSGKMSSEKDNLIRSDIGFKKYFLKSLGILVGMLLGPTDLCVFSVLSRSSTSSLIMNDKRVIVWNF